MTLGSLFDGAGGFPLAGETAGFTPLWASEIEPFPIRVTTSAEYKMWGNSLAIPCAYTVLAGIAEELTESKVTK